MIHPGSLEQLLELGTDVHQSAWRVSLSGKKRPYPGAYPGNFLLPIVRVFSQRLEKRAVRHWREVLMRGIRSALEALQATGVRWTYNALAAFYGVTMPPLADSAETVRAGLRRSTKGNDLLPAVNCRQTALR